MACVGGFGAFLGFAFIYVGFQTVTGAASDTRGNGIGSFVFSLLNLGGNLPFLGVLVRQGNIDDLMWIQAAVVLTIGFALLVAGVLAFVGRSAYLEWRSVHRPQSRPRRRRGRRNEDDADD